VSRSMVSVLVAMWPSFARAAPEKRAWLASKPTDGIGRLAGAPKARPFGTSEAHQPSGCPVGRCSKRRPAHFVGGILRPGAADSNLAAGDPVDQPRRMRWVGRALVGGPVPLRGTSGPNGRLGLLHRPEGPSASAPHVLPRQPDSSYPLTRPRSARK
jgi:hypothetical protein